jgi:hypothetical protein
MKKTDKILLVKILTIDRVDGFLDGNIYMNSDAYFSKIDQSDAARFDADEDVDEAWQVKELAIRNDEGEYVPIGGIINPIRYRYGSREHLNIFCLHMIVDLPEYSFDEKNLQFGEAAIVIRNSKEFTTRMRSASESLGRKIHHGPVTYLNKTKHHGVMGPFRKFDEFAYQSEFRFVLHKGDGHPTTVKLGDIRDICFSIPSKDIPKLIPKKGAG